MNPQWRICFRWTDEGPCEAEALQTEYADLETRHRAAIVAEGEEETRVRACGIQRQIRTPAGLHLRPFRLSCVHARFDRVTGGHNDEA